MAQAGSNRSVCALVSRYEMQLARIVLALVVSSTVFGAEKYTGPRPPKADVPYLLHADNLIETEIATAKSENRKDTVIATLPGANSPVKTPLAEPIFIIKTEKLAVDKLA